MCREVSVSVIAVLITAFRTERVGTRAVRKIPELFQYIFISFT